MPARSTWNLDSTLILARCELTPFSADLTAQVARHANAQRKIIIVHLVKIPSF